MPESEPDAMTRSAPQAEARPASPLTTCTPEPRAPSPRAQALARRLVRTLPADPGSGLFNPWRQRCAIDARSNGPRAKLQRLAQHLDVPPRLILCAEAAGYQGKRHTGVAFASERLVNDGAIPRVPAEGRRLTRRERPYTEPSGSIVWRALHGLGVAERTVIWNALPLHPHRPGEADSNRTPTAAEFELGRAPMGVLLRAFPGVPVVAVGTRARALLERMGVAPLACIRHPARGGGPAFEQGLSEVVAQLSR